MWSILVVGSVRVIAWVAFAISSTPCTCAQYHSSKVALTYYISRAKLPGHWGKNQSNLGLGLVQLKEHYKSNTIQFLG